MSGPLGYQSPVLPGPEFSLCALVLSVWTPCPWAVKSELSCPFRRLIYTPFHKMVEVEDVMVGEVLHAHATEIIDGWILWEYQVLTWKISK